MKNETSHLCPKISVRKISSLNLFYFLCPLVSCPCELPLPSRKLPNHTKEKRPKKQNRRSRAIGRALFTVQMPSFPYWAKAVVSTEESPTEQCARHAGEQVALCDAKTRFAFKNQEEN